MSSVTEVYQITKVQSARRRMGAESAPACDSALTEKYNVNIFSYDLSSQSSTTY